MSERVLRDLRSGFPHWQPDIMFDVGANTGQTARKMREIFPSARVHSFEPVPASFQQLSLQMAGEVTCHNFAFGSQSGQVEITATATSSGNSIQDAGKSRAPVVSVPVETGAAFCSMQNIDRLSFLKIDTEGHDLEVLVGFLPMLVERRVDAIQVEASMNALNRRHVQLSAFLGLLEPVQYYIYRIHDQHHEKHAKILRRCNVIFVGADLAVSGQRGKHAQ